MYKIDYSKNVILILFLLILMVNLIACGTLRSLRSVWGPVVTSRVCSNPVWFPSSDKIAYFEEVDYAIAKIETEDVYKSKLVLHIKSLTNPLFHKKISWTVPDDLDLGSQIHLSFSPKGDKIVFGIGHDWSAHKKGKIFIADIKRKSKFQKIIDDGLYPEWSSKENIIIYQGINQDGFFTTDDGKFEIGRNSSNWGRENRLFEIGEDKIQITPIKLLIGQKPKWSSDGNKIIFSTWGRIFIADRDGKSIKQIKVPYTEVAEPALSPDAAKVVFCKYTYGKMGYRFLEDNLYIANVDTGAIEKEIIRPNGKLCSNEDSPITDPVWSPNGEYIAYIYDCGGGNYLFIIKTDGTGLRLISGYRRRPVGWW